MNAQKNESPPNLSISRAATNVRSGKFGLMNTLTLLLLFSYSLIATAQASIPTPWEENFGNTIPTGWSGISLCDNCSNENFGLVVAESNYFIRKFLTTSGNYAAFSIPVIGPVTAGDNLSFQYMLKNSTGEDIPAAGSGSFTVQISTNGGTSYTVLEAIQNNGISGFQTKDISLANYVGSNIKLRIYVNKVSPTAYNISFDNFRVGSAGPLAAPIAVSTAFGPAATQAKLSWSAPLSGTPLSYEYHYSTSATPPANSAAPVPARVVTALTASITGLISNTTYYTWVRANYSGGKSNWTGGSSYVHPSITATPWAENFQAIAAYGRPSGWQMANSFQVIPDNMMDPVVGKFLRINLGTAAPLSMTTPLLGPIQNNSFFKFVYRATNNGSAIPAGNGTLHVQISTDNGVTWDTLENGPNISSTGGQQKSYSLQNYTGMAAVFRITVAGSGVVNYQADFDDFSLSPPPVTASVPWNENLESTNPYYLPSGWEADNYRTAAGTSSFLGSGSYIHRTLGGSNGNSGIFVTTAVGALGPDNMLSFKYRVALSGGTPPPGGTGQIEVRISTNNGSNYTSLGVISFDGTAGWIPKQVSLASYQGQTVKLQFAINKLPSYSGTYAVGLDDFQISGGAAVSYNPPTTSPATQVTASSAYLNWAGPSSGTPTGYEYYYSTNSAAPTTNQANTQTTNNPGVQITNLPASTTYHWWVRALYTGANTSAWVSGGSFTTTAAATFNPPITAAATQITTNSARLNWSAPQVGSPTAYEYYYSTSATQPGPTQANVAAGTPSGANISSLSQATTYYWWARAVYAGGNKSAWAAGTAFTTSAPAAYNPPLTLASSQITTNSATISWSAPASGNPTGYEYYYSSSATAPSVNQSNTQSVTSTSASLSGLNASTTFYWWVRATYPGNNKSAWASGQAFSTLSPSYNAPAPTAATNITINSAKINWNAPSSGTPGSYEYYVSTNSSTPAATQSNVVVTATLSAVVNNLNPSTTYYWWVRAVYGNNKSSWGPGTPFTTLTPVYNPPITSAASAVTPNSAKLNWSAPVSGSPVSYEYYYSTSSTAPAAAQSNTLSTTLTGITITNLSGASTYYWWVRSVYSGNNKSAWVSGPSFATLNFMPPASLQVTNILPNSAKLQWAVPSYGSPVNYEYHVSVSPSAPSASAAVNSAKVVSGLFAEAGMLNENTQYYWWVRALYTGGARSAWTAGTTFTTAAFLPPAVGPVSSIGYTNARLNWTAPGYGNPIQYEYKISTVNTAPSATQAVNNLNLGTSSGASVTSLTKGTTYYWWVRAIYSNANKSVWSAGAVFTTRDYTPPILNTASNIGINTATISWSAPTFGTVLGYEYFYTSNDYTSPPYAGVPVNAERYVTTLHHNLSGLNNVTTTYYWYVRAVYEGNILSSWAAGAPFTTKTAAPPTNPSVSSITENSATINWELGPTAAVPSMYEFHYTTSQATVTPGNVPIVWANTVSATNNSKVLTGLLPMTAYKWNVRAIYPGDITSTWMSGTAFTTATPFCAPPTQLNIVSVNTYEATISWAESDGIFEVEYGIADFVQGTPNGTIETVTGDNQLNLYNLSSGALHEFYVRRVCASNNKSTWSGPFSFRTELIKGIPWTEKFQYMDLPPNWSMNGYSFIFPTYPLGVTWEAKFQGTTSNLIHRHATATATGNHITTYKTGAIQPNHVFAFNYKMVNYANNDFTPSNSGKIRVELSTDDGSTFSLVEEFMNEGSAGWVTKSISLAPYAGSFVILKISDVPVAGEYYIGFDDFTIVPVTACEIPDSISTTSTSDSITLSWASSLENVEIRYGLQDFDLNTEGTLLTGISGNSYSFNAVEPETTYDFYVRSICSDGSSRSFWSEVVTGRAGYCAPHDENTYLRISSFVLNGAQKNSTSSNGYENFTNTVFDLTAGNSYVLNVSAPFSGYDTDRVRVWIDLNQDLDFDDEGELVLTTATHESSWSGNISIPVHAMAGHTRMRVILHNSEMDENAMACGGLFLGQVEDYTVNITVPVVTIDQTSISQITVGNTVANTMYPCQQAAIFAKITDAAYTSAAGANPYVKVWIGRNAANTNPATWDESAFTLANYNGQSGVADVYRIQVENLQQGQHYFASRVQIGSSVFVYGGTQGDFWNASVSPSAILTVNPVPVPTSSQQEYSFCALELANVGTLKAELTGNLISVFDSESSATPLPDNTLLETGTYYASQKLAACESSRMTIYISVNPVAVANFPTQMTLCAGESAASLSNVSPNGIMGTWSPATINNMTSGTYVFTPDSSICALPISLSVVVQPAIVPDFDNTVTICYGDTMSLDAQSPNGIYGSWSPAEVDNTQSGTYIFTPAAGQCAASMSLAVIVNEVIVPDFTTNVVLCANDSYTLLTTSPNGVTGTWSPFVVDMSQSGEYVFTPSGGQCAQPLSISIVVLPQLVPDFATQLNICSNDAAPVLANFSANGIEGTWSPDTVSNTVSGNYIFTPASGYCAQAVTLSVSVSALIMPDFISELTICGNANVPELAAVSPNGITGSWTPAVVSASTSGEYVFIPDSGQCAETATLTVTISDVVTPDFTPNIEICAGELVELPVTSPNGISGSWSPSTVNSNQSGTYVFTPADDECASSVTVSVSVTPSLIPDFATAIAMCPGTVFELLQSSPNGVTGTWHPAVVDSLESGTYVFTPDQDQCAASTTLQITIQSTPAPEAEPLQDFEEGQTLENLQVVGTGLLWYDAITGGNLIDPSTVLAPGTHYFVSQTINDCEGPRTQITAGQMLSTGTIDPSMFRIYPNPVSDILIMESNTPIVSVSVYNMLGQLVTSKFANQVRFSVDMASYPEGTYVLHLSTENGTRVVKVLKN